ncbi:hypothetical protein LTR36_010217 [Oleoguttula mirabilis]|uniref:Uncharacterized protein n=1 Tax=Oleoguttula mirabilis TaxID=1507867 RepID=A0AAV9JTM2_9PEZI|nr:hypothetical protein LTR36_010217 [Oleoguttula mirabilis]
MGMVHLYKALKHYNLLQCNWNDMDWYIECHSKEQVLIHEVSPSADPMACVRHFELALGVPIGAMSTRGRATRISARDLVSRHRLIRTGSDFLRAMQDRWESDRNLGFSRGERIDVVLRAMREKKAAAERDGKRSRQSQQTVSDFTGLQLLQTYKELVVAYELEINFDHIGFWTACADMLATIRTLCQSSLPKAFQQATSNSLLVGGLLYDAADYQLASRPASTATIAKAATVLQKYIDANGDKFIKAAFEQSSGHLPGKPHSQPFASVDNEQRDPERTPEDSQELADGGHDDGGKAGIEDTIEEGEVAPVATTVRDAFAARKRRGGRRLLRTRK